MTSTYHIKASGNAFIVIDPWGEQLVDVFPTEDAAKRDIERCKSEDLLYDTAGQLVDLATKTLMKMHSIDRQTALYWIRSATETTGLKERFRLDMGRVPDPQYTFPNISSKTRPFPGRFLLPQALCTLASQRTEKRRLRKRFRVQ
jgi:hypothetical protein